VAAGRRSVIARVLDHQFPKWRHFMDDAATGATVHATIRRADLLAAAAVDRKAPQVRLTLHADGVLTVATDSSTQTVAATDVQGVERWDGFMIAANPTYLLSILAGIASSQVRFSASKPGKPMLFADTDGPDRHLLMPVKIAG
jgi:DNA polymerase III sliding clamp (beta) subunit (PCNA family)